MPWKVGGGRSSQTSRRGRRGLVRGLFKTQDLVEAGVDENGADPGFQVGEPEFMARVAEPLECLDEHAEARTGDVVQVREVQGRRFPHHIQRGLGAVGLSRVEPAGKEHEAAPLDADIEHQSGNLLVSVMIALPSLYSYRIESEILRTRVSPSPRSEAAGCLVGADVGSKDSTSKSRSVMISSSRSPPKRTLTSGPPPLPCFSMLVNSSSMRRSAVNECSGSNPLEPT